MLRQRLPVGLALTALFIGLLAADSRTAPYFFIWHTLVILMGFRASVELAELFENSSVHSLKWTQVISSVTVLGSNATVAIWDLKGMTALIPMSLTLVLSCVWLLLLGLRKFDGQNPIVPSLAMTLLGVFYIGGLGSFLTHLRIFNSPLAGAFALALIIGITKGTDTGAYTFGKLFGRHLMTPLLSPKKTWEGAIGGVIFALVFAQIISLIEHQVRGEMTLHDLPVRCLFAILVSISGQLGDLIESMIKRECHQKDASSTIPGFGGVLDLLDSLFLAAPVGWVVLTILS